MLIDAQSRQVLEKKFSRVLKEDVDIKVFTRNVIVQSEDTKFSQFSTELIRELSQIDDRIKPEYLSFGDEAAKRLDLSLSPTIVIGEKSGYSIQYWGVPAGQAANSLIETIALVSQRKSGLQESLENILKSVDKDILIETFFGIDLPASSQAVLLSNRMAVALPGRVMSRSIEAEESAAKVNLLNIRNLPSVFINENRDSFLSGPIKEEELIRQLVFHGASDNETLLAQLEDERKKKETLVPSPDFPVTLSTVNFDEALKKYSKLVIDCWAEWCGPCLMVHPIIENLAKKYKGEIAFAKLDIDQNKEIAERFGIMSIPTLLVFKQGQNVDSILGAMPEEVFEEKIRQHLA